MARRAGLPPRPDGPGGALVAGRRLAIALPELMIRAREVADTVTPGWHGRRRAGPGEDFWQFRPLTPGESLRQVDWRRSGRDDQIFIRERELENAHTVHLWTDLGPAMDVRSATAPESRLVRGLTLMLALAELLARAGERVGLVGEGRPATDRKAAERLADAFARLTPASGERSAADIRRGDDVVLFGDFYAPRAELDRRFARLAGGGARLRLVQLVDPEEAEFPFTGRLLFTAPGSDAHILAGRAEDWRSAYRDRLAAHQAALDTLARGHGGSLTVHRTDEPPATALLALHRQLSEADGGGAPGSTA